MSILGPGLSRGGDKSFSFVCVIKLTIGICGVKSNRKIGSNAFFIPPSSLSKTCVSVLLENGNAAAFGSSVNEVFCMKVLLGSHSDKFNTKLYSLSSLY